MEYVERLINCGMPPEDALYIVDEFLSDGDPVGLELFVLYMETEYVGAVPE